MKKLFRTISIFLSFIILITAVNIPSIKVNATGTTEDFVVRCYQVVMGRTPADFEKQYWVDRLTKDDAKDGRATGGFVAYSFLISPEYLNKECSNAEFVENLYKLFMDRKSDTKGLEYWCSKLETNELDRLGVIAGFINSEEFYDICFNCGITAGSFPVDNPSQEEIAKLNQINLFVDRMYDKCMGRRAEYQGQYYWLIKLLTKEITGADCAHSFYISNEFTGKNLSEDEYIETLYRTFMGRAPEPGGKEYWLEKLSIGMTRDEVFQGFAMSPEFAIICSNYGIERGKYTATDVSVSSQTPDNSGKETYILLVRKDYNNGDYVLYQYDEWNNNISIKRYDKNNKYIGYDHRNEISKDGSEQILCGKNYYEGELQYEYYSKIVYTNSDRTRETQYEYSDEWKTIDSYTEWENENYINTVDGISYEANRHKKGTFYDKDGKKTGSMSFEYDSYGRTISQKQYINTWIYSEEKNEYFDKGPNDDSEHLKKKENTFYNYDGSMSSKDIYEYNEKEQLIKQTKYSDGKLESYSIEEYDSNGNQTKTAYYDASSKLDYYFVYVNDSNGNRLKQTEYDSKNVALEYIDYKYDANNKCISAIYKKINGEIIWEEKSKYNANGQKTYYCIDDGTEKIEELFEYDNKNNEIKYTKKKNGTVIYWEKNTYKQYTR